MCMHAWVCMHETASKGMMSEAHHILTIYSGSHQIMSPVEESPLSGDRLFRYCVSTATPSPYEEG